MSVASPMRSRPSDTPAADGATRLSDDVMLDRLQHAAFDYFLKTSNPQNGLVADTTRDGSPSSIAVVGFALSAYPVAVEHGWIERADAVQRTLHALRFFWNSDQSGNPDATGHRGFYFHFLDMHSGARMWQSELSLIDTALLVAGMLTAAAYFTAGTKAEVELRELADALYRRVDWRWAQRDGSAVMHGWKPECGFLHYGWEGYSEAILLYVLGLGSPTHPLTEESFQAWTVTYQWENLYGHDFLYAGPLFIHQFSHAWIDFRGIQDRFMREKGCDYFENSRRATYVQREYATRNPRSFIGYAEDCWGLSAGDGPSVEPQLIAGRRQAFYGYAARGVPYGPDDGTIAGSSTLASLVFAPEIALPAVRKLYARATRGEGEAVRASGFNPTVTEPAP
ncbi:MAG TPA: glucoamylase family protein, partial [Burkholderiaceae bacterium]